MNQALRVNLASLVDGHPDDRPALIARGRTITYGQLRERVARLRGGLVSLGVRAGDRVALLCGNSPAFVETYLATVGLGAIAVPLNPASPAPELHREILAVEPVVVVIDGVAVATWPAVAAAGVPSVRHVVSSTTEPEVPLTGALAATDLDDADPHGTVDVDPATVAALMFTSGTAGPPRAAMLTHGNLLANIEQAASSPAHIDADDIVLGVLPLFHIFGLNVVLGLTLARGATLVLVPRFDPFTTAETIREHRVTVVPGAPPMWVAWSALDAPPEQFASVRLALTGAARMPVDAMLRLDERFGLRIAEGYGLTEASPIVSSSAGLPWRPGSVGAVLSDLELRLVDETGADVVDGDVGEIWVRGANVFPGYWQDPQTTARVLTADGWLRTGDIASVDDEGYLYLVDRAKDLIIVSGFNVYPAEVEAVLADHPAVAEVGVVGVPHPHTGETVSAFVVPRPGSDVDEEQLIAWTGERLARYKCPTSVALVDELPRNATGKLVRRELI